MKTFIRLKDLTLKRVEIESILFKKEGAEIRMKSGRGWTIKGTRNMEILRDVN